MPLTAESAVANLTALRLAYTRSAITSANDHDPFIAHAGSGLLRPATTSARRRARATVVRRLARAVTARPQPKRSHGAAAGAGASTLTSVRTLRAQ
jgi:hypothetical protein